MLTVLIATYNGAKTLPDVLRAYCALDPPADGWNLVIVDNGSTDQTENIIASFRQHLPLTYLFEPRQGKNAALNTGLLRGSGDLVVFSDDDVLPRPNWLKQLRLVADSQPLFSIFGGPILPKWESPPEDWLLTWVPMGPTFTIVNSLAEGPMNPWSACGPNMAIRAEIFKSGHQFDEAIGPKGTNYAMGSESEFLRRLAKAGFRAWHCRDAVVEHIIRSFQMNKEWVLGRAVRYGRGQYRLAARDLPDLPVSILGIPMTLLLSILAQGLRVGGAKLSRDAKQVFTARWQLNFLLGKAIEARLLCKERANSASFDDDSISSLRS